jgi:hypothetical protein
MYCTNWNSTRITSSATRPPVAPFPLPRSRTLSGSVELDKSGDVVNPAASPASAGGNNRNRNQRMQHEKASMDVEDEDKEVFSIFAARTFEQLSQAYREKLTQEQQLQLKKAVEVLAAKAEQAPSEEEIKMKEEERAKKSQAQEEERMTAEGGGFFASASQFQLTRPEMYEIHGPQVWCLLKYGFVDFLTA